MAVVYFTNNASTGSGSLAAAVAAAKDGDVIRPDETVFGRGATVEIALASRLDVRKTLTIDGGACRIRLNGGSSVVCLFVREGDATFINVDVVAGRSASTSSFYPGGVRVDASATFKRCRIAGCESQTTGGAMFIASGGVVNLVDCLVAGNRSASEYGGLAVVGVANVAGSTLVGNVAATGANDVGGGGTVDLTNAIVGVNAINKATSSGSVVGVALSQIGFVAPPPDDLTSEDWTAELWQSWDLRLLDDASDAPSPYRDSGDVDKTTQYDLDGNFRGRETNGASTCSPGAYETLQADLFWVGRDATGAQVVSPSFLASDGWAASRFAAASGDAAPQLGQTLFVGDSVAFVDAAPQGAALIVGGGASVSTGASSATTATALTLGRGATYNVATTVRAVRFAEESRVVLAGGALIFDAASSTADAANPLSCVDWSGGRLTFAASTFAFDALTVPTGATLTVDGASVNVATLTVADGASVAFSGVDAILTATETATVGAASFSGTGYFATPQGTDASAATFAETIRVSDFGAGVADFAATATGPTTAKLEWSATDETARVCVERENTAAPNGWETLTIAPTAEASPLEVALSRRERFRVFDGATFTVDSAWFPTGDFYVYVADDISAVAAVAVEWETATQLISAGNVMYRNENVLLLASVKNKLTADYLNRDEVESATATVYAVSPGFGAREIWTPVDGWADVAVPLDAILEAPTEIGGWTLDAVGPNFVWTPDATTRPLFGDSGTFAVQVCVKRKSGGNPIYFTFRAVVK